MEQKCVICDIYEKKPVAAIGTSVLFALFDKLTWARSYNVRSNINRHLYGTLQDYYKCYYSIIVLEKVILYLPILSHKRNNIKLQDPEFGFLNKCSYFEIRNTDLGFRKSGLSNCNKSHCKYIIFGGNCLYRKIFVVRIQCSFSE